MRVPALRTERLLLRPFERPDAVWLAESMSDPEVKRLTLDRSLPVEQARVMAEILTWLHMRRAYWAITLAGEPCGFICLTRTGSLGPSGAYVGFELRRAFWGRGIATEATRAVAACAFEFFGLRTVRAAVLEPNEASMRVLEKAGLRRGGAVLLKGARPAFWYEIQREPAAGWRWRCWWRVARLL